MMQKPDFLKLYKIMIKEKDIKDFIRDNKIQIPEDDAFMTDLVRQMNLLPVPSSLSGPDEERIKENLRILEQIRIVLKRRCRREAARTLLFDVFLCGILFILANILLHMLPEGSPVMNFIVVWKNFILGIASLIILALSFSQTGVFKV